MSFPSIAITSVYRASSRVRARFPQSRPLPRRLDLRVLRTPDRTDPYLLLRSSPAYARGKRNLDCLIILVGARSPSEVINLLWPAAVSEKHFNLFSVFT